MSDSNQAAEPPRVGSTIFWRVMALLNIVTVAWVVFVVWQIAPNPVVNEFVTRMPVSIPAAGIASRSVQAAAPEDMSAGAVSPQELGGSSVAPLRMETELTSKVIERPAAAK